MTFGRNNKKERIGIQMIWRCYREAAWKNKKTRTSTAVKRHYSQKHYKIFSGAVKFYVFGRIEEYGKRENISRADFCKGR